MSWAWLGGAVAAIGVTTALLKAGAWIARVNDRLDRAERALRRLGGAVEADEHDQH